MKQLAISLAARGSLTAKAVQYYPDPEYHSPKYPEDSPGCHYQNPETNRLLDRDKVIGQLLEHLEVLAVEVQNHFVHSLLDHRFEVQLASLQAILEVVVAT